MYIQKKTFYSYLASGSQTHVYMGFSLQDKATTQLSSFKPKQNFLLSSPLQYSLNLGYFNIIVKKQISKRSTLPLVGPASSAIVYHIIALACQVGTEIGESTSPNVSAIQ